MIHLAHVINPVVVNQSSDLYFAQPVTFETMRRAKAEASAVADVSLCSVQYEEDTEARPADFVNAGNLDCSVLDVAVFNKQRKLPLIKDVLSLAYQSNPQADYIIYTNVDIALQPHFYTAVVELIGKGYDAFVINRRTISDRYESLGQLSEMYEERGERHFGHDCFVFRRDAFPAYILGNTCIGTQGIGRILLLNLAAAAENFREFKELYLTFHIGCDRAWQDPALADYVAHNLSEVKKSCEHLGVSDWNNIAYGEVADYYNRLTNSGVNGKSGLLVRALRALIGWIEGSSVNGRQ